jgi:hypothetical protein
LTNAAHQFWWIASRLWPFCRRKGTMVGIGTDQLASRSRMGIDPSAAREGAEAACWSGGGAEAVPASEPSCGPCGASSGVGI